jgi:hypothetical protein
MGRDQCWYAGPVFRECERNEVITDSKNAIFKKWYARMLTPEEQFYDRVKHSLKLKTQLKSM